MNPNICDTEPTLPHAPVNPLQDEVNFIDRDVS